MGKLRSVFMLILIGMFSVLIFSQFIQYKSLSEQERVLQLKLEEEEKVADALRQELDNYSTDLYIEKIAREQLGLIRPDETVYIQNDGN